MITGRLQFDDEKAKQIVHPSNPQARRPDSQAAQVLLYDARAATSMPAAKIDDNDSFLLEEVQRGQYQVSLSGIEGAYVRSMRLGQTEIEDAVLDLTHGVVASDDPGGTELVLSISSATGSSSAWCANRMATRRE